MFGTAAFSSIIEIRGIFTNHSVEISCCGQSHNYLIESVSLDMLKLLPERKVIEFNPN